MEDIIISTTKLSDLLPFIIMAFILSLSAFGLIVIFYVCDYGKIRQNADDIEELKKELHQIKTNIKNNLVYFDSKASLKYVDELYEKIKRINKRLNRLKMPLYATEKKESE